MSNLGFDTKLDFGKHSGKVVADLLAEDVGYLLFLRRSTPNNKGGVKMAMDLHLALDAVLYAVGFNPNSQDKPKYPREVSDKWVTEQQLKADREREAEQAQRAREAVARQKAAEAGNETYSAWGAW